MSPFRFGQQSVVTSPPLTDFGRFYSNVRVSAIMARISYQNSTFRSFYKFDIRLLNWTFVLFISTFVLFASAFVFQGEHSFYINNIRFSKWTFA